MPGTKLVLFENAYCPELSEDGCDLVRILVLEIITSRVHV